MKFYGESYERCEIREIQWTDASPFPEASLETGDMMGSPNITDVNPRLISRKVWQSCRLRNSITRVLTMNDHRPSAAKPSEWNWSQVIPIAVNAGSCSIFLHVRRARSAPHPPT